MHSAIDTVKGWEKILQVGEKILQVAKLYNVPHTWQTLQDKISGWVIHESNPGPKPRLSQNEENELAEFLVDTGYIKNRKQIQMIATNVAYDMER